VTESDPSFFARIWLAIVLALRVVLDAAFAGKAKALLGGSAATLPAAAAPEAPKAPAAPQPKAPPSNDAALALLALFQREGRLVDFLQQEVDAFADAEIGAAARVVHQGCRKALLAHFELARVRDDAEGSTITLAEGFDGASIKLTGDVRGSAPYRGVLRHSGWRVREARLPERVAGHDVTILAPAEVEL
jgi:hypothetical protein